MALFTQYAIAAAEEALGDAGLLGNMTEEQKNMAVRICVRPSHPVSLMRDQAGVLIYEV